MRVRATPLLALLAAASLPRPASAVDAFEIQVYEGDINVPLQAGIELHSNFVAEGRRPAGEVATHHVLHETLEPSFGVLTWWEVGAYLQLFAVPGEGKAEWGGFKLRSKFVVPRARTGDFVLGLNFELGRGSAALGDTAWDTEVRPILVWAPGRWLFAWNPILGWAVTGERHAAPDLEPAAKIRWDTARGFGVGCEYYAGLGLLNDLLPVAEQQHTFYVVADLLDAAFELNLGVGRGLTGATDAWTVKMIFGLGF